MGDTIIGVQFGIANPDDILKRSVVEVTTDKTYQSGQPVPNGVFDVRFGVIESEIVFAAPRIDAGLGCLVLGHGVAGVGGAGGSDD